jgi:hypothetical protein
METAEAHNRFLDQVRKKASPFETRKESRKEKELKCKRQSQSARRYTDISQKAEARQKQPLVPPIRAYSYDGVPLADRSTAEKVRFSKERVMSKRVSKILESNSAFASNGNVTFGFDDLFEDVLAFLEPIYAEEDRDPAVIPKELAKVLKEVAGGESVYSSLSMLADAEVFEGKSPRKRTYKFMAKEKKK